MDPIREAARYIKPSPVNDYVFYLQSCHRSEAVWQGHKMPVVRPHRHKKATFKYPPREFVLLLISSGFYGAARAGFFPYEWHMVTDLLMRWRAETHTFHLAIDIGEASITLEDIAIQLGLPIDGKDVVDNMRYQWLKLCQELLGKTPRGEDIEGVFLMPNTFENMVQLMYLPLLRDLEQTWKYSWGSAVLAFLFRFHSCTEIEWPQVLPNERRCKGCGVERLSFIRHGVVYARRDRVYLEDGQHVRD
ncbi:serine/threonine-protein phosphatase 7 long form-like protein [Senna tora]|uniref:Serine/threonine-protein phosphatase 7 long form-like protein n=1 Tax=Senna tora TaxID=362788 RepID=A0A835CHC7_9FABA|nr:serine/threonine-protein phosphatase 7 long form-like protein [Senna tora]